jgi:hypothetical protein
MTPSRMFSVTLYQDAIGLGLDRRFARAVVVAHGDDDRVVAVWYIRIEREGRGTGDVVRAQRVGTGTIHGAQA